MDYTDYVRTLEGGALDDFARELYERDVKTFEQTLIDLTRRHTQHDYEAVAQMVAQVPLRARSGKTYTDARFGMLINDEYFNFFLNACAHCGCGEFEYMALFLNAQYAKAGSALYSWDKSVDRYLDQVARADYELAAAYIDSFDKKYRKYSVLIALDKQRTVNRLLVMALYGKNVDKGALRDVLMDYADVAESLISLYRKVKAKERAAIVRVLMSYKNDVRVKQFINEVARFDSSASVRRVVLPIRAVKTKGGAAAHIERLMAEGCPLTYSEWRDLLADEQYRAVAEKIFFYREDDDGGMDILLYNDGEFIDTSDRPVTADDDECIFVLHTLDLPAKYDIEQPFPQVNRPVYARMGGEGNFSNRLSGTMIARKLFNANMRKLGFVLCAKRNDGEPTAVACRLGEYVVACECDFPDCSPTVSCGRVWYYRDADVVRIKNNTYVCAATPLEIPSIDARAYSEMTYLACRLFSADCR